MFTDDSIEIDAPAQLVVGLFSDVERWPEWTEVGDLPDRQHGANLAVGRRFSIKQPGMPKLIWTVTELDPGRSWTWVQTAPGAVTSAHHEVVGQPDGRTLVRQQLVQRGVLGTLVARLMIKKTKRFLQLEAQGLKNRCEHLHRVDGTLS